MHREIDEHHVKQMLASMIAISKNKLPENNSFDQSEEISDEECSLKFTLKTEKTTSLDQGPGSLNQNLLDNLGTEDDAQDSER